MYVYVKIGTKKIKTKIVTSFKERIKGFRFQLEPIKEGLCFPKRKAINTCFLCQKIDIIFTDKDYKILYLYPNIKSEKFLWRKKKAYYIFELPLHSCEHFKIGDTLEILSKKG